jgi:hypothetical protein
VPFFFFVCAPHKEDSRIKILIFPDQYILGKKSDSDTLKSVKSVSNVSLLLSTSLSINNPKNQGRAPRSGKSNGENAKSFRPTHAEPLSKYKNLTENNLIITSLISPQITRDNKKRDEIKKNEENKRINGTNTIIGKPKPGNTKSDILAQLDQSRQPPKRKSTGTLRKQPSTENFIHLPGANILESSRQQTLEKKKMWSRPHQEEQTTKEVPSHSTLDTDLEMEGREDVQVTEQEQLGSSNINSSPNPTNTTSTASKHLINEDLGEESEEEQPYLSQPIPKKLRKPKETLWKEQPVKKPQVPQVPQASNVPQAPPTPPQKFKLIFNKNALKKIERGNVGHYFFRLTNNTTNYEKLVHILAGLVEPIHTQQHLAQLNILTVFFEPTTMVAGVEEKLQHGGEIVNMLMSVFGVTVHEGRHIDEETGKLTIQVLRMNVMNPPADTDEQEVRKELHRTGIVDYNNLTVFYN